jgi:hypothetical protein
LENLRSPGKERALDGIDGDRSQAGAAVEMLPLLERHDATFAQAIVDSGVGVEMCAPRTKHLSRDELPTDDQGVHGDRRVSGKQRNPFMNDVRNRCP